MTFNGRYGFCCLAGTESDFLLRGALLYLQAISLLCGTGEFGSKMNFVVFGTDV